MRDRFTCHNPRNGLGVGFPFFFSTMHGSADPSKHSRVVDRDNAIVCPSTTGPSPPDMDSNAPCYFKIVSTFIKVKPIPVRLVLKVLPCGLVCIVGRFRRPSRGM